MAIPGVKPKDDKVTRTPVVHDWHDIPDVPFADAPKLTGQRSKAVQEWWTAISTMPHCSLWTLSDWRFAMDTARLVRDFYGGETKLAGEIRMREAKMGTTLDARRDLRIRYVPLVIEEITSRSSEMTDFVEERRRRLMEVD